MNDFCNETGRKKLVDRLQVDGYNRSVSGKATAAAKAKPPAEKRLAATAARQATQATVHLLERSAQRGIETAAINNAVSSPLHVKPAKVDASGRKSQQYIGKDVTVAINPDNGNVISVWNTGQKARKKYEKE